MLMTRFVTAILIALCCCAWVHGSATIVQSPTTFDPTATSSPITLSGGNWLPQIIRLQVAAIIRLVL